MGLTDGLKRAQKVKGTHTVPFKRKKESNICILSP